MRGAAGIARGHWELLGNAHCPPSDEQQQKHRNRGSLQRTHLQFVEKQGFLKFSFAIRLICNSSTNMHFDESAADSRRPNIHFDESAVDGRGPNIHFDESAADGRGPNTHFDESTDGRRPNTHFLDGKSWDPFAFIYCCMMLVLSSIYVPFTFHLRSIYVPRMFYLLNDAMYFTT